MKPRAPVLLLVFLLACCFSLATVLEPRASGWTKRNQSQNALAVLLGEGRRLFANHFFVQADVYFHSGYYPSIFDSQRAPKDTRHLTSSEGEHDDEEHEKAMDFLGPPRDWIERFGRKFMVTTHTHLSDGNERDILPWLRLSAELDPQRIDTYTVSAYWLRSRLGRIKEAEQFLREGIRNNPHSFELLFELGRLYDENYHDSARARNVMQLALKEWNQQESKKEKPDLLALEEISVRLGRLEEQAGHLLEAIRYLELGAKLSPNRATIERDIAELKQRLDFPTTNAPSGAPSPR